MHIYDVTNPQGLFCQSKATVKCNQHLVLLKPMYSLPSFLLFFLLPYQWQLDTVGKPSKKRNVKGLNENISSICKMAGMGNSHVYQLLMRAKIFTFEISWFRLVFFLRSFRRREMNLLFFLAFSSLENKIITSYMKS